MIKGSERCKFEIGLRRRNERIRKSTDFGLTNAERKSLRETEAQEAMSDHDDAEKAFHENRERLQTARLAREAVTGPILYPAPGIPDETPIDNVRFRRELPMFSKRLA